MSSRAGSYLFSLALTTVLFGMAASTSRLWTADGPMWLTASRWIAIPAGILLAAALVCVRGRFWTLRLDVAACAWGIPLTFVTDWLCHPYSPLLLPVGRGEILLGGAASFALLRSGRVRLFAWLAPAAALILAAAFFVESGGRPLFSDDHATFVWRLTLLKRNFPDIPFFNPLWNGGVESRDFFATGALGLFFLAAPLLAWLEPVRIYNVLVAGILFLLAPGATFAACRIGGLRKLSASIAALLVLSNSVNWYRWALAYGTMGFILSTALLPLVLMLAAKALSRDEFSRSEAIALPLAATLMLFWPFAGVVALPAVAICACHTRTLLRKRFIPAIAVALIVLNGPWMAVFWQASSVATFMQADKQAQAETTAIKPHGDEATPRRYKHRSGGFDAKKALRNFQDKAKGTQPVLLFLGIPGIFLLRRRSRTIYLAMSAWLLFLGTLAVPLKPQLELDRMLIVLGICLAAPAGTAVTLLFEQAAARRRLTPLILAACVGGYLFAAPFTAGGLIRNRSLHQYRFMGPEVEEFLQAVRAKTPPGSRLLFTGCVVHQLSGGHLAPFVLYTGVPMIASSFHHDLWWYTDILPLEFREAGDAGIERYLDLYNVGLVAAHEPHWQAWLQQRADLYKPAGQYGRFMLFERQPPQNGYFLEGHGEVLEQDTHGVTLRLDAPDAVLKFNYLPFLQASGCSLRRRRIEGPISFIELTGCPAGTPVRVEARGPIDRFFLSHLNREEQR